ncbi:helix-turn-helix transcriptional regulator [Comamonas sp. 4034]|uniref:DNA-binding transcriptional regulator AlpA n=2 Tax=Comamonas odontotermitis TaxID=379895 RepID=A0ABR6RJM7_9BURK|nr:putative DNA-binding transcriptional regulator AlpA [Comamonas odontotermitis]
MQATFYLGSLHAHWAIHISRYEMKYMHPNQPGCMDMALLRKHSAAALIGLSKTALDTIVRTDPSFPRPIKLGEHRQSAVLFDEGELNAWIDSLKAKRSNQAAMGAV